MHLYVALLGGPMEEGLMGEGHEIVMVVAPDPVEAKARARAKWHGVGRGHVDAVQRIETVDGYGVSLEPVAEGDGPDQSEIVSFN
jgi:hypothetical protein